MAPHSRSWGFPRWRGYGSSQEATVRRMCDRDSCGNAGEHKAPVSPKRLDEFYWFCQEHAEEYNRNWNYFQGRDHEEAAEEERRSRWNGKQSCWETVDGAPRMTVEARGAMLVLGVQSGDGIGEVKSAYKRLAKEHHPDRGGDPEKFKSITRAYSILVERLKE